MKIKLEAPNSYGIGNSAHLGAKTSSLLRFSILDHALQVVHFPCRNMSVPEESRRVGSAKKALLLHGEHDLDIDEKNRLLIPSDLRKSMDEVCDGKTLFIVLGRNKRPWLYPEFAYLEFVNQRKTDITPGDAELDFAHMMFALAEKRDWDSQGRIVLHEKWLSRTKTGKEVTLIGSGNHMELWNRADWNTRREKLWESSTEIAMRDKQERLSPNSGSTTI